MKEIFCPPQHPLGWGQSHWSQNVRWSNAPGDGDDEEEDEDGRLPDLLTNEKKVF